MQAAYALSLVLLGAAVTAPDSQVFRTRLAPLPIDVSMQATIAGSGTVTATLSGARLVVTGSFEGLKSPATTAAIRRSPMRGVRGPEVHDLQVTPGPTGTSGTIAGSIDLAPQLVADLRGGRLYVQLHSEKAPDGNLWGWLLEKR